MVFNKLKSLEYLVDIFNPPYHDEWMEAGLSSILCIVIKSKSERYTEEELRSLLEKSYKY